MSKSFGAKLMIVAALTAGTTVAGTSAAEARTDVVIGAHFGGPGYASRNYYGPHYWGGPRVSVGLGIGPYWGSYWDPYYYPYPYYRSTVIYRDYGSYRSYDSYRGYDSYRDYDRRSGLLASPYVQQALVADVGESVTWTNSSANGIVFGRVTTTRDGWSGEKYCREFVESITVDNSTRDTTGTACQAPGGTWQLVANQP